MNYSQNLRSSMNGIQQSQIPYTNSQQLQPITTTPMQQHHHHQVVNAPLRSSIYETPKVNRNVIVGQSYANQQYATNDVIYQQPQSQVIERVIQQPQQVTQVIKPREIIERVIEQVVPGEIQQVVRPAQTQYKEITQTIPGEIIEKVIEKIVPQIQIEERIIEVEKPVEVIVVKERKGAKKIKEKVIEKAVYTHKVHEIPGKEITIPKHIEVEYEKEEIQTVEKPVITYKKVLIRDYAEEKRLKRIIERLHALLVPKIMKTVRQDGDHREIEDDKIHDVVVDPYTTAHLGTVKTVNKGAGFGGQYNENPSRVNQGNYNGGMSRSNQQYEDQHSNLQFHGEQASNSGSRLKNNNGLDNFH